LEPAVKAKMLTLSFVLPTEKCLVVSFWTFFQILSNNSELKEPKSPKEFVDSGISF